MKSIQSSFTDEILNKAKQARIRMLGDLSSCIDGKMRQNSRSYKVPLLYSRIINPDSYTEQDTLCYTFGSGEKCVFYLHGGSYVYQPMVFHWRFLQKLYKAANVSVVFPIYNKAPHYTCETVVPQVAGLLQTVLKKYSKDNVYVMGDSAGGGLAVAVSKYCADNGLQLPASLTLFSPWLDVSMRNPEIQRYLDGDYMLYLPELMLYGTSYRGNVDRDDYRVYGVDVADEKFPPTDIFVGSADMLFPDCLLFKHNADKKGAKVRLYEFPHMQHVFALMPIPEGTEVFRYVTDMLTARQN